MAKGKGRGIGRGHLKAGAVPAINAAFAHPLLTDFDKLTDREAEAVVLAVDIALTGQNVQLLTDDLPSAITLRRAALGYLYGQQQAAVLDFDSLDGQAAVWPVGGWLPRNARPPWAAIVRFYPHDTPTRRRGRETELDIDTREMR